MEFVDGKVEVVEIDRDKIEELKPILLKTNFDLDYSIDAFVSSISQIITGKPNAIKELAMDQIGELRNEIYQALYHYIITIPNATLDNFLENDKKITDYYNSIIENLELKNNELEKRVEELKKDNEEYEKIFSKSQEQIETLCNLFNVK